MCDEPRGELIEYELIQEITRIGVCNCVMVHVIYTRYKAALLIIEGSSFPVTRFEKSVESRTKIQRRMRLGSGDFTGKAKNALSSRRRWLSAVIN